MALFKKKENIVYFSVCSFLAIAGILIDAIFCNTFFALALVPVVIIFSVMITFKCAKRAHRADQKIAPDIVRAQMRGENDV